MLATGTNMYLNIHCDKDFITCATSVHVKKQYHFNDDCVIYFAFPILRLCNAQRPGDILFFNANEPHAASSMRNVEQDIYCLSLYLKASLMGLNANSRKLYYEEKVLNEYL